jgi:hypothetical protein
MLPVSLEETINAIRRFMQPVVDAIIQNEAFEDSWSHDEQRWVI